MRYPQMNIFSSIGADWWSYSKDILNAKEDRMTSGAVIFLSKPPLKDEVALLLLIISTEIGKNINLKKVFLKSMWDKHILVNDVSPFSCQFFGSPLDYNVTISSRCKLGP